MIQQASKKNLQSLLPLFQAYRTFYKCPSVSNEDIKTYLTQRLTNNETVIFIAFCEDEPVGFTLLYPSFTTLGLGKKWILYDLFVSQDIRQKGIGRALLDKAVCFARHDGAKQICLETARDNTRAKKLYENYGFIQDTYFEAYSFAL